MYVGGKRLKCMQNEIYSNLKYSTEQWNFKQMCTAWRSLHFVCISVAKVLYFKALLLPSMFIDCKTFQEAIPIAWVVKDDTSRIWTWGVVSMGQNTFTDILGTLNKNLAHEIENTVQTTGFHRTRFAYMCVQVLFVPLELFLISKPRVFPPQLHSQISN